LASLAMATEVATTKFEEQQWQTNLINKSNNQLNTLPFSGVIQ
jgi:hypothetical protein